eukprot:1086286-Prorocentrum_minimum.AAC.2
MLQAADSASSLAHAANSGATRSRTKPARTRIPPLVSSFRVLDSARARLGLALLPRRVSSAGGPSPFDLRNSYRGIQHKIVPTYMLLLYHCLIAVTMSAPTELKHVVRTKLHATLHTRPPG